MFLYVFTIFILFFTILGISSCSTPTSAIKTINKNNYLYSPPFEKGKRFLISQAFHGNKTHVGALNEYAVDLVMPRGSLVCAARSGKVSEFIDNSESKGFAVKDTKTPVNYVQIKHTDGTTAIYAHLEAGSITVKKGQQVKLGECFSKSGNSGVSSGPHLHFSILLNSSGKVRSIPFSFVSDKGIAITPKYLKWLNN